MTEEPQWEPLDAIRRASAIVILVHGVGAHSVDDMVGAAVRGYRAAAGSNALARRLDVTDPATITGAWLEDGDAGICVVPAQWSDVRERLGAPRPVPAMRTRLRMARAEFAAAIGAAKYASNVMWAAVVALSAIMVVPALAVFVAGEIFWYTVTGVFILGMVLAQYRFHFSSDLIGPIAWAAMLLAAAAHVGLPALLDMVFDVARYVHDSRHRAAAVARVREVINAVRLIAPDVPVIVAAHSLGSVLVTQALIDPDGDLRAPQLLMTMGSPLRTLSRVFGKAIRSSADIGPRLTARHPGCRWINVWRDADRIGRSLHAPGAMTFEEISLGDGAHTGYWADARLWQSGRQLATNTPPEAQMPLLAAAGFRTVTPEEADELAAKKRASVFTLLTSAGACVSAGIWRYSYVPLRGMTTLWSFPVQLISPALLVLAAVSAGLAILPGLSLLSTDRDLLARYRYRHAQMSVAALATAAATVSLAILAVWLVAPSD